MATHSWMPTSGRHAVAIGTSLGRTLKARKGGPAPKNRLPDRDFYSFRYNFKPESVDSTKSGTIDTKKGKDTTQVSVERASTQTGDGGHMFVGKEEPAREWDCVLIYDEDMGTFTLEKLDSYVSLHYDRKTSHAPRHAGSPLTPPPPSRIAAAGSSSSSGSRQAASARSEAAALALDAESELGLEDAEGEIDDEIAAILPESPPPVPPSVPKERPAQSAVSAGKMRAKASLPAKSSAPSPNKIKRDALKREEEESEGEIMEKRTQPPVLAPEPSPKPASKPSPPIPRAPPAHAKPGLKAGPSGTSTPRPRPAQALPIKPPARSQPLSNTTPAPSQKRTYADVEEETIEFGRPAPSLPAKRARPSPPPEKAFALALPGGPSSTGLAPALLTSASAPAGLSFPGSSSAAVSLPSAAPISVDESENEESDWSEVEPVASTSITPPVAVQMPPRAIQMEEIVPSASAVEEAEEEEEEIDMNAFELELNQAVGGDAPPIDEEEDFLAAAVSPVADRGPAGVDWGDEDDYSSSEDSDED